MVNPARSAMQAEVNQVFQDLAADSLTRLLPALNLLCWLWTAYLVLFWPAHTGPAYGAFFLIAGSSAFCFWQIRRRYNLAVGTLLVGLWLAVTLYVVSFHQAAFFYLYLQVILVAAVLAGAPAMGGLTLLAAGTILVLGWQWGLPWTTLAMPTAMLLFTAMTAWLSAQRLFTALDWALTMFLASRRNAEEARAHRAELQGVLRSLDIAYARLERANRALIFAQEAAERAYRFKSDFVANVSHELRTPLNLIVGFAEMMATAPESYGGVTLPREYRGDVMAIYRSARHLLDLINDVLDLSQIEAGRMVIHKERVDLVAVVQEAAEMVRGLAEARGLRLDLCFPAPSLPVELDRTRIRQVLLNLLTNAMRYTDAGWVRVAVEQGEDALRIWVEDTGRGIDPAKLHKAFEAFSRLDEEHLTEGTGLGLAVSKKFVELHGGQMGIESQVGRGTRVHFTLPLPEHAALEALSAVRLSSPVHPRRDGQPEVLVLHDDERVLNLFQRHLPGYRFELALSPEEANRRLRQQLPDLILVDRRWREQWPELLQRLGEQLPIPILSCPLPSVHHVGLLMGATDYLPKPVMRDDLAAALARLPRPPRTALVVDDDPHVVRLIARMLKAIDPNLRVFEAFGGREGLAVARAQRPDVIFLDLVMPEVSGYSIVEAVTQEQSLAGTAIIVVSVRSVEQELAPMRGEFRLQRSTGFSLTELLHLLQAQLATLTRPDAVSPTSAAAALAAPAG
ncbi:response regulator [Litorilinea aerophila]|nr:response regulator [Litorilinea aerophila]